MTISKGAQSVIIGAGLVLGSVANAEPLRFACYGEMRVLGPAGIGRTPEKFSLPLTLDVAARTAKVGDYGSASITSNLDDDQDSVSFLREATAGVSTGGFNRITGALSVHILDPEGDGLLGFRGFCKPATKLF
jgi:hypothetical protein